MRSLRSTIARLGGTLLVSLVIAACSDNTVVSPNAAFKPAVAAFDAIPGTPDWLAPLGGGTTNAATFDPTAINRVQVCVWLNNACSGPLTAQFSTTPGAGVGMLTVNTVAGRYEASLDLTSTSFLTRRTYRISAVNGTTVGRSILVDIVRGRWALARIDRTLAPLSAANALPIQFHVAAPLIRVNEVESSGGTPGDWVEITNIGTTTQDVSGFVIKDNNDAHVFTIPNGTLVAPGAFLALDVDPVFGLGAADMARVYSPTGLLVDSYSWTAHAVSTWGRCPNGTGAFVAITSSKGTANSCAVVTPPVTLEPWAGTNVVTEVDVARTFSSNASGLMYESGTGGAPDVLWVAQNGPGSIHRMIFNGTNWVRDQTNGWANGKHTKFTNNTGEPDTEDLTFTTGSAAGMYIVSERNNQASSVSRLSILRYDVTGNADSLIATHEWNLTADLPAVGANLGFEAITWVPDNILTAQGFRDVNAGHAYIPAEYADHAGGLFFVGVEGTGMIHVYALNHTNNTFTRIASVSSGFPAGVMALSYDRELGQLWATCDNTCGGQSDIFVIDQTPGSPTLGQLRLTHTFARPSNMPDTNNEGFTFAPQSACVAGFKPAFWSDDNALNFFSIRAAMIPCVKFP